MKKYLPYIKKYWYSFLLGPLFMTLEAAGEFILPYVSADIINNGAATGDVGYIIQKGVIMLIIAVLMLVTGVPIITGYLHKQTPILRCKKTHSLSNIYHI